MFQPRIRKSILSNHTPKFSGPKLWGKSSSNVKQRTFSPSFEYMYTGTVAPNSRMTWRQIPQGLIGSAWSLEMAMAWILRCPSITILVIAVLSAQMAAPYRAFSTLAPVMTWSPSTSKAQPTLSVSKCQKHVFNEDLNWNIPELGVWRVWKVARWC